MSKYKCHAEHCGRPVNLGHLMCAIHWRHVSKPTQVAVYRTFASWKKHKTAEATAAWRDSVDQAIAQVRREEALLLENFAQKSRSGTPKPSSLPAKASLSSQPQAGLRLTELVLNDAPESHFQEKDG